MIVYGYAIKSYTDLRGASLSWADLSGANLHYANLSGADLSGANLCRADLSAADLRGANLWGADLRNAHLYGADLSAADLLCTTLDPAASMPKLTDSDIRSMGLEIHGNRVCGWRTAMSLHCANAEHYTPHHHPYVAPWFSVDTSSPCHPGIYLSGLARLREFLDENSIRDRRIVRVWCYRSELVIAGSYSWRKCRCRRLWVTNEGMVV